MYKIIFLLFFIAQFCTLNALQSYAQQALQISPEPVIYTHGSTNDFDLPANARIYNNTNTDLEIAWVRTIINLHPNWAVLVCDTANCWTPTVSTKKFWLKANQSAKLNVHFQPNGTQGNALVHINAYAITDSANLNAQAEYQANVWAVGMDNNNAANTTPQIWVSNPKNMHINLPPELQNVTLQLKNAIGNICFETTLTNSYNEVKLPNHLPTSFYIVALLQQKNKFPFYTQKIIF